MKFTGLTILFIVILAATSCNRRTIQIADLSETEVGSFAAGELHNYLSAIYKNVNFKTGDAPAESDIKYLLTSQVNDLGFSTTDLPVIPESFKIVVNKGKVWIISPDERGLLNATYALLEELGYGFFISGDKVPSPRKWTGYKGWEMEDHPVSAERFVLNWHNFLSGCTGWNFEDWCSWIDQVNKMRYNGIMLHFYGNNPAFSFEFLGERKNTGYLNNTANGRDWGNQHVNDVRRLTGGEIFDGPVFGSAASMVSEDQKEEAATHLMQRVFDYAKSRGTKIILALDFDTWMANPSNIVQKLPDEAIFRLKGGIATNPVHPEGYQYYEQILETLLEKYPQITQLSVWHRIPTMNTGLGSIWMNFPYEALPAEWKKEYHDIMGRNPGVDDNIKATSMFAYGKLIAAFQKIRDQKWPDLEISSGSWRFEYLPLAHTFFPADVPLIPLDWAVAFDREESKEILAGIGSSRKVWPVVWAHHDDHRYIGRPYTPWANFASLLKERKAEGFGVIHWTTRPLDLYFTSTSRQVWNRTVNEPLETTVADYVAKLTRDDRESLELYFNSWITTGPMFGRETSNHFVDIGTQGYELDSWTDMKARAIERLNILEQSKEYEGNPFISYQRDMEKFYISFFNNQELFQKSRESLDKGNIEEARALISESDPDTTLMLYVKAVKNIGFTQGEKALVSSMNIRWKADFINLRQQLGLAPVLFRYSPTRHDSLAQAPGSYTYHIDEQLNWWRCIWDHELDNRRFIEEKDKTALWIDNEEDLELTTMHRQKLVPGNYELKLNFQADGVFEVAVVENDKAISSGSFRNDSTDSSIRFQSQGGDLKLNFRTKSPLKLFDISVIPLGS
jgi:hypothetical protein